MAFPLARVAVICPRLGINKGGVRNKQRAWCWLLHFFVSCVVGYFGS